MTTIRNPEHIVRAKIVGPTLDTSYRFLPGAPKTLFTKSLKAGVYFTFLGERVLTPESDFKRHRIYLDGGGVYKYPKVVVSYSNGNNEDFRFRTVEECEKLMDKIKDQIPNLAL